MHSISELDATVADTQRLINSIAMPHIAKYIIIQRDGREHPLLFPRALHHNDMLSPSAGKPVSAGFYQIIDHETLLTDGQSTSLNLRSRPQDATLIRDLITSTIKQ